MATTGTDIEHFQDALKALDKVKADRLFRETLGSLSPIEVVERMVVPALEGIGQASQDGTIAVRSGLACDGVWVEVADSGSGMPPEVQRRMFEPFFSTKPVGKGTCLGMSISYDIIKRHGGRFEVDSAPAAGTRIRAFLPCKRSAGADADPAKQDRT